MSLREIDCPGCIYAGQPHLETCPESAHIKYRRGRVEESTYYPQDDKFKATIKIAEAALKAAEEAIGLARKALRVYNGSVG